MSASILAALRSGDFASALAAARTATAKKPDDANLQYLLGLSLQGTGDAAAARVALERAVALDPDTAAHRTALAALDLGAGQVDAGDAGLREAVALNPNELGSYVMQIHRALANSNRDEAGRLLRLAQRIDPGHPMVVVAEGHVAHAAGDHDKSLRCFTAAAAAQPNLASAQLALGFSYLERKMWPFAEQALANALRLDPNKPRATFLGLIEAQRQQGKREDTLATIEAMVARHPDDIEALGLRAELLVVTGQLAAGLDALRALLDRQPLHLPSLRAAGQLLARSGQAAEARTRVEAALSQAPAEDELWVLRLQVASSGGEDPRPLLERWRKQRPDSPACLEMFADFHHSRGELAEAERFADQVLALQPTRFRSGMIKLRAEEQRDPDLALARVDRMLAGPLAVERQRGLQGWAGMNLDAQGRHAEAAERWRDMLRRRPELAVPPALAPAEQVPPGEIAGTLLWSPVGVRAEFVLETAKAELGARMNLDRANGATSGDGFGLLRYPPGHEKAGSAARWTQALQAAGQDPAAAIDWLPHLDAYTLAALRGARVLALLVDPRDALLNWMVHGSLQNYLPSPDPLKSAQWLAGTLEALADHRDANPGKVTLACLDLDAAAAASTIEATLGLGKPLPAVFGSGLQFAPGHWRKYREAFAAEMAALTPVAVRLGYPAE